MSIVSQIKAIVFRLAPGPVKDKLIAYNENRKVAYWQECFKTKVSREEVDALFAMLDLRSDVMVHSSLPDIGDIKKLVSHALSDCGRQTSRLLY